MTRPVHLVGSINLPSAVESMETAVSIVGDRLRRLPDGEPGPRRGWVFYQRPHFTHNRFLTAPPGTPQEMEILAPRVLREGVRPEDIEFPELGYAREAQTSFAWFRAEKEAGRIPEHLRFQVSLPTPLACMTVALEPEAIPQVAPAYEAAMLAEVAQICDQLPRDELAIQWDVCVELILYDGRFLPVPWDDAMHRACFRRLQAAVPEEVHLGIHLCYGDYDGKHLVEPLDGRHLTELANLVASECPRPLQWMHLPVPIERDDDAYFAPFAELALGDETEIFLGLVHLEDGVEGTRRRIAAASKHLESFGIATECGIGRAYSSDDIRKIFHIHREAADG